MRLGKRAHIPLYCLPSADKDQPSRITAEQEKRPGGGQALAAAHPTRRP